MIIRQDQIMCQEESIEESEEACSYIFIYTHHYHY